VALRSLDLLRRVQGPSSVSSTSPIRRSLRRVLFEVAMERGTVEGNSARIPAAALDGLRRRQHRSSVCDRFWSGDRLTKPACFGETAVTGVEAVRLIRPSEGTTMANLADVATNSVNGKIYAISTVRYPNLYETIISEKRGLFGGASQMKNWRWTAYAFGNDEVTAQQNHQRAFILAMNEDPAMWTMDPKEIKYQRDRAITLVGG